MRERRKQHKLNKSAEQTNSQQKKGFNSNLDTLPLSTQEPKAQEEETQTNKQTNKHANRDLESNLKKKKNHCIFIYISKHPGKHNISSLVLHKRVVLYVPLL